MSCSRETCLAWLSSAGIAPEALQELLQDVSDPAALFRMFQAEEGPLFEKERPVTEGMRKTLRLNSRSSWLDRTAYLMEQNSIRVMTRDDEEYPARIRPLPEAPAILFYQGDPGALLRDAVSMVGSRNASLHGLEATARIAEKLSRSGITVNSGLAWGIDAAAHRGCLKGGSPTVAVLGCGLDQDYPRENAALRREILDRGGLILSEYTPGEKPLGWHFPWRNRIISGLGNCLVLMEARIRSGSMTTVQHALNQGRDVFVYPGEPNSPKTEGNHQLLREGAIYFTTAEDLMEDMGWLDKMTDVGQNTKSSRSGDRSLPPAESAVLSQLDKGTQSFDQLCDALSLPAAQMNAVLCMLQIQGLVAALPGKLYQKRDTED